MFFKFRTGKVKIGLNFLDLTPVKKYAEERNEAGLISIVIPRFKSERLAKIFLSKNKSNIFKVLLDELGSATWSEITGTQNVSTICQKLEDQFGEKIHPAEQRTIQFLSTLYQQKCITFLELNKQKS